MNNQTTVNDSSAVQKKYGIKFILFSNLWELERAMSPDELRVAREIRMASVKNLG